MCGRGVLCVGGREVCGMGNQRIQACCLNSQPGTGYGVHVALCMRATQAGRGQHAGYMWNAVGCTQRHGGETKMPAQQHGGNAGARAEGKRGESTVMRVEYQRARCHSQNIFARQ